MRWTLILCLLASVLQPSAAVGEAGKSEKPGVTVPVFEGEVDRPYRVVGEIKDNLRKHFVFQANPTKEKIYAELWERAQKMGADAVVNARYGPTQATAFNHGRTAISGTAIVFDDLRGADAGS